MYNDDYSIVVWHCICPTNLIVLIDGVHVLPVLICIVYIEICDAISCLVKQLWGQSM